ncbi:unnamed protein product [Oppiella nova]|uniref:Uncharacterized protein n=1 Tax=Oppiella nova TaxID=334625 RepID=A0A7R9LBA5_9ACAR|nr:unnamed protein product [Oppiella nova]CAG2159702.1 unnamed protein product [Oppiella nova]
MCKVEEFPPKRSLNMVTIGVLNMLQMCLHWLSCRCSASMQAFAECAPTSEITGDQHLAATSFISDSLYNPSKNLSTMLFTETSYKGAWGSPSPSPSQVYNGLARDSGIHIERRYAASAGNSGDKLSPCALPQHPIYRRRWDSVRSTRYHHNAISGMTKPSVLEPHSHSHLRNMQESDD